jgi:hypothetical protein
MANRFCSRCNAEVEDAGGFCLLGHALRPEPPADSLTALRAEVNRTFDEAREQLAEVMAPAAAMAPVVVTRPSHSEPALPVIDEPARPSRFVPPPPAVELEDHLELHRAEGPAEETVPEPTAHATVWDELDDAPLAPGDPIAAFAPEPRMDWGPRKTRFLRKRPGGGQLQTEG